MAEFNLKAMLTKKLGPLPAWGWGLVIGGGYLGYRVLSGKGVSLTGTNAAVETVPAYEDTTGNGGGAGYAYGEGGGVPSVTIINQFPEFPEGSIPNQDDLARSKAYAKRMKERGDNWAAWGKRWKAVATRPHSKNAKAGTREKTKNTGTSKRKGTQGTQLMRPYKRNPIDRGQNVPANQRHISPTLRPPRDHNGRVQQRRGK